MDDSSNSPSRRALLAAGLGAGSVALSVATAGTADAMLTVNWSQTDWRFCGQCYCLVRLGDAKNRCSLGSRTHWLVGWNFRLDYTKDYGPHAGETPHKQSAWLRCSYCAVLYYKDFGGSCPGRAGAVHKTTVPFVQFLVPHDVNPVPRDRQSRWRFCTKCSAMYFDGYAPDRGVCRGNGTLGHAPAGNVFQLPIYHY
ncbi:hypothetical protein CcI49_22610 [Frankia sp. CcI49]|uniref:hypothetical protein n=1 Tax=Frankia sp. CcI49 TaxID=1745382 RepID=UPI000977FA15|nr:hypothetical protein [Frankia sp. CcI49]ONH58273.1 hypothetical protein CcI49_22610 [Frankia sp. CcI49]